MNDFNYYSPESLEEILSILSKSSENISFLAGGTDLIIQLRNKEVQPNTIINLTKIKELNYIKEEDGFIKIGAMTTFTDIEKSTLINEYAQALAESCREVGSPQIRNTATIGGNIANASPAADSVPVIMALEGKAVVEGPKGKRELKMEEILLGINKTSLDKNEILTEIYFKKPGKEIVTGFRKLGRRAALAIARINVAVAIEKENNLCNDLKIVLGAVAKNPFRALEAEDELRGKELTDENINNCVNKISEVASKTLGSRASAPFKKESIKGIGKEAIYKAING